MTNPVRAYCAKFTFRHFNELLLCNETILIQKRYVHKKGERNTCFFQQRIRIVIEIFRHIVYGKSIKIFLSFPILLADCILGFQPHEESSALFSRDAIGFCLFILYFVPYPMQHQYSSLRSKDFGNIYME